MKQILRLSLVALCTLFSTFTFADTYSYVFEEGVFKAAGTENLNGVDWTLETDAGYFGFDNQNGKGQQIGSSKKPATTAVLSTSGISGTITSIKVNTSGASDIVATLDVTVGGEAFGDQYTLVRDATDVEFIGSATGEIKLNYTNSSSKAIYIKSIEVTYTSASGVTVDSPKFSLEGGVYTEPQTLTLTADEGCTIYYTENGENPTKESTLYTAPITVDKTMTVKAVAYDAAGNASGIASETYTFPVACENIAAAKAQATGTLVVLTFKDAQVVYVNSYNNNTEYFVRDASGAIDLYRTGLELKQNDILNGTAIFEYSPYNGLPELVKADGTNADNLTVTEGAEAQPVEVSVADLLTDKYMCDFVTVKNVNITTLEEGNYTNTYAVDENENKVMLYDKFKLGVNIPTDTEKYDVTGILGTLNESTNEVFLLSIEENMGTGIDGVTVDNSEFDENAPVYNLAGQRVSKNAKGILIQNGKKFIRK